MSVDTVIYYHRDLDGIASAYAVYKSGKYPEAAYESINYGEEVRHSEYWKRYIFVDFTPKITEIDALLNKGNTIYVYDHHVGAKVTHELCANRPKCHMHLDVNAKGACTYVWNKFNGEASLPYVIERIGHRDVWDFTLPHTEIVCEAAHCRMLDIANSAACFSWLDAYGNDGIYLRDIGELFLLKKQADVKADVEKRRLKEIRIENLEGVPVWQSKHIVCVNTQHNISDVGNELAKLSADSPSCCWRDDGGTLRLSFRSIERLKTTALDVAKECGGGGHIHAAGAEVKPGYWRVDSNYITIIKE
jgi:oligoribonuclease NrnB/cAMP/cGMP phosphodiesterase (DHH superfamily)